MQLATIVLALLVSPLADAAPAANKVDLLGRLRTEALPIGSDAAAQAVTDSIRNLFDLPKDDIPTPPVATPAVAEQVGRAAQPTDAVAMPQNVAVQPQDWERVAQVPRNNAGVVSNLLAVETVADPTAKAVIAKAKAAAPAVPKPDVVTEKAQPTVAAAKRATLKVIPAAVPRAAVKTATPKAAAVAPDVHKTISKPKAVAVRTAVKLAAPRAAAAKQDVKPKMKHTPAPTVTAKTVVKSLLVVKHTPAPTVKPALPAAAAAAPKAAVTESGTSKVPPKPKAAVQTVPIKTGKMTATTKASMTPPKQQSVEPSSPKAAKVAPRVLPQAPKTVGKARDGMEAPAKPKLVVVKPVPAKVMKASAAKSDEVATPKAVAKSFSVDLQVVPKPGVAKPIVVPTDALVPKAHVQVTRSLRVPQVVPADVKKPDAAHIMADPLAVYAGPPLAPAAPLEAALGPTERQRGEYVANTLAMSMAPAVQPAEMEQARPAEAAVPAAAMNFEPAISQDQPDAGLFSSWWSSLSWAFNRILFGAAPPAPKVAPTPIKKVTQAPFGVQDFERTAAAAAEDSFANIDIHDDWFEREKADEDEVARVKGEDRVLGLEARTLKHRPTTPSNTVNYAGSTHISNFWAKLAKEDEEIATALKRGGEDVTEYARLVDIQDAKVAASVTEISGPLGDHLAIGRDRPRKDRLRSA